MDDYQETFNNWDKIAGLYQDKFMHLILYNTSYDYFCKALDHLTARILDLGCGLGNISHYLLKQNPQYDILGLDRSPNMIKLAERNNPTASFQVLNLTNLDEIDKSFDGIVAGFSLPYLSPIDGIEMTKQCSHLLN